MPHGRQIAEALLERPDDEDPWVALRRSFDSQVELIVANKEWYLRLSRLLTQTASIRARQYEKSPRLADAPGGRNRPSARKFRHRDGPATGSPSRASALSCLNAATEAWTEAGGAASLSELLDLAMGAVRPTASGDGS